MKTAAEPLARPCSERIKPVATMGVESSSKVVANLVRTLLRSPRCTAHHQLMGSSDAHAQEHDSDWNCGGPVNTSVRRLDECRCGRQVQTRQGLRAESLHATLQVPEPSSAEWRQRPLRSVGNPCERLPVAELRIELRPVRCR